MASPTATTLSVTRAARYLGVHPNTIRSWTERGRLTCFRINARGDRRYRISDLDMFLASAEGVAARLPGHVDTERHRRGATEAALAAEVAALRAAVDAQLNEAAALQRINADITSKLDLEVVLARLMDHALVLFGGDRAAVFQLESDGLYTVIVSRGLSDDYIAGVQTAASPPLAVETVAAGRALFAVDYATDPKSAAVRARVVKEGFNTIAMAPLSIDGAPIGVVVVYHDARHDWTATELSHMTGLAGQASVAIANARNFAQMATWAAHLQSIQHLGARLSRLGTVNDIGMSIVAELRQVIDYHSARVYRVSGIELIPVAWRGEGPVYADETAQDLRTEVGVGITGWVAQHGQSALLDDAALDPRVSVIPGTEADLPESMLAAPMLFDSEVVGVIVLSKLGIGRFSADDLRLLEICASFAAQAAVNADTTERLRAQSARLEHQLRMQRELLRITESFLTRLDPREVLEELVDLLAGLVHSDTVCLLIHDPSTASLRALTARGVDEGMFRDRILRDDEGVAGWVFQHGESQLVNDELGDPRIARGVAGMPAALVAAPLRGRDGIVGVLTLQRRGDGAWFSPEEFELVQLFAAQASIAFQNAERHRAVEVRAQTDALTLVNNQGTFHASLGHAVQRAEGFALLVLDIDQFKAYNDSRGHQAGDELLRSIARALESVGRESDSVFRYGGDEFAMILPATDGAGARAVGEKVRSALRTVVRGELRGASGPVTCSIGIATFPNDANDAQGLLLAADRACYVAKRAGRDRVASAEEGLALAAEFLPSPPTPMDGPEPTARAGARDPQRAQMPAA